MSKVGSLGATAVGQLGALAQHAGYLQVNSPMRIPLKRGSNTTSDTRVLFPQHGPNDMTTITIGRVESGTTVDELISAYPTLSDLLSAMFNIIPEALLMPVNASFSFTFPSSEFEAGTTASVTTVLRLDRGEWEPQETSGGAIPYGPVTQASFRHPMTAATIILSVPPNPQPRVVEMSHTLEFAFPETLIMYTAEIAQATTALGDPAYNQRNKSSQMPERQWYVAQPVTLRNFHYVWRDGVGVTLNDVGPDVNAANEASSPKIYADTASIVVSQQTTEEIYVQEKEPQRLAVYVKAIFDAWIDQPTAQNAWSKRFEDGYWIVSMASTNRGAIDIRISF